MEYYEGFPVLAKAYHSALYKYRHYSLVDIGGGDLILVREKPKSYIDMENRVQLQFSSCSEKLAKVPGFSSKFFDVFEEI